MRKLNLMLKEKLNTSFHNKNEVEESFSNNLLFFAKSLKKNIILFFVPNIILFFVPNIFIFNYELKAQSQGRQVQNLVRSGAKLQARKRQAYENSQKESGLIIKLYLKNAI